MGLETCNLNGKTTVFKKKKYITCAKDNEEMLLHGRYGEVNVSIAIKEGAEECSIRCASFMRNSKHVDKQIDIGQVDGDRT